jgi:ABC-2 type transport system permease protein
VSVGPTIYNFWIIIIFANVFLLSLAVSLILSTIYIVAKDITQIWQVFTSFLFFLSPIFYRLDTFRQTLPNFDYLNPVAGIIINARRIMMENSNPDFKLLGFDLGYALILLVIGFISLNKLGSKAAEKL